MRNARIALASCLLLFAAAGFANSQIVQDEVRLTTPTAPWTISIEGKDLAVKNVGIRATPESAYFLIYDAENEMNISFYVEPVDKCKSSDECRDYVLGLGNPAWGKYRDLAKGKVADFSYFEFFRPEVRGQPLQMLDMYAQFVDKGYWIDLHISKVLYKKEQHRLFEELVKKVKFLPKAASAADSMLAKAEKSSTSWLGIWDAGRCRESYASLSPISQKGLTVEQWLGYCRDGQAGRGKVKERQLIASTMMKTIAGAPGLSGAQLHYRSVFEIAGARVELVTFVLEPDGKWTVANYLIL